MLNFEKVTAVIGIFTPIVVFIIFALTLYTFVGKATIGITLTALRYQNLKFSQCVAVFNQLLRFVYYDRRIHGVLCLVVKPCMSVKLPVGDF